MDNDGEDSLNFNLVDYKLMKRIVNPEIRLKIFLSLYLHPELYVSQLSRFLNVDKNTASRHLRKMEKEGILKSRVGKVKGKMNRKYYRLTDDYIFNIDDYRDLLDFDHPILRIFNGDRQFIKEDGVNAVKKRAIGQFFNLIRALILFITKNFELYQRLFDNLKTKIDDTEVIEELFGDYFKSPRKIDFYPIFFSAERLKDVNKVFNEYTEKLLQLRAKGDELGEEKSMMMIHALIPIKDVLQNINQGEVDPPV